MSQVSIKQESEPEKALLFDRESSSAPGHMAIQPLDHFKRGYQERADFRDRETNQLVTDFESPPSDMPYHLSGTPKSLKTEHFEESDTRQQSYHKQHHHQQQHRSKQRQHPRDHPSNGSSAVFDVVQLVDHLCHQGCNLVETLDRAKDNFSSSFLSGKALTAILSNLARRRKMGIALSVWEWMDERRIEKNVYHYNSLISVCEKVKDYQRALRLLEEMEHRGIPKNEVTFSSAISACEKAGQWRVALDLLDRMKREGVGRTAIAYNAAISACEKGLVPHKALELFKQMKSEGVVPTVITYSALISAAEKGQQWKLALDVLEEMKASGHGPNVIAYSAAISALSKGQMWEKALELFREIERSGNTPSIVTYNATMTALEKGLQWERALDLFDEMKAKRMPITVVSYGSAISACEKGLQYRQCLEYLDEMTELGIRKNVIIFGAAMSCMEKCCRADIAFQLMERMKMEGVVPNVHIYNSAISACARCNLWEKGLELFEEMERVGVVHDVVSFNAVLDAVSSQVKLGRRLFELGVQKGFYSRVSRLGNQWLELDVHFLSLGGGEIALGWWFEECLIPYLSSPSKLAEVKSIDIVTGYGKTRMRGIRHGDDGMRKRVRAMLKFMNIEEIEQPNKGRIHIDKESLIREVGKNGGRIKFDYEGYVKFKEENTTANHVPDVAQNVRPRYFGPLSTQDMLNDRPSFTPSRDGSDRRGNYDNSGRSQSNELSTGPRQAFQKDADFALRDNFKTNQQRRIADSNHGGILVDKDPEYPSNPSHGGKHMTSDGGGYSHTSVTNSNFHSYHGNSNFNGSSSESGHYDDRASLSRGVNVQNINSTISDRYRANNTQFEGEHSVRRDCYPLSKEEFINDKIKGGQQLENSISPRIFPRSDLPHKESFNHKSMERSQSIGRPNDFEQEQNWKGGMKTSVQLSDQYHGYSHDSNHSQKYGESGREHTGSSYYGNNSISGETDHMKSRGPERRPAENEHRSIPNQEKRYGHRQNANRPPYKLEAYADRHSLKLNQETRYGEQGGFDSKERGDTQDKRNTYGRSESISRVPDIGNDKRYDGQKGNSNWTGYNSASDVSYQNQTIQEKATFGSNHFEDNAYRSQIPVYRSKDCQDLSTDRSSTFVNQDRPATFYNGENQDFSIGEKRSIDFGHRQQSKRRGYDIDSHRSLFNSSRGY